MLNLYGLLISFSIILALFLTEHRLRKKGYSGELVWKLSLRVLPLVLIGARLYHVFDYWNYYAQSLWQVIAVWNGGLGIIGGLAGGVVGVFVCFISWRPQGSPLLTLLDAAAPGIAFAQGLGRWANVLNNELLPYAYYESVANLLLFLFLLQVGRVARLVSRKAVSKEKSAATDRESVIAQFIARFNPGATFLLYLLDYTAIRLALEHLHPDSWTVNSVSIPYIALPLVTMLYAVVVYLNNVRKQK